VNSQPAYDEMRDDMPDDETSGGVLTAAPEILEVRRNGGLAAFIGAAASGVAIAYLGRATQTGAALDWAFVAVMGLLGAMHLRSFVDARTPLLVADSQGVRLRLGRSWRGLPWGALSEVEHTPRPGLLRDGRLVFVPHNAARVLSELDSAGRRQSRVSERLYGAPFALPLGITTRVLGVEDDLTTALRQLAGDSTRVVEPEPAPGETDAEADAEVESEATPEPEAEDAKTGRRRVRMPDPRPGLAHLISVVSDKLAVRRTDRDELDGSESTLRADDGDHEAADEVHEAADEVHEAADEVHEAQAVDAAGPEAGVAESEPARAMEVDEVDHDDVEDTVEVRRDDITPDTADTEPVVPTAASPTPAPLRAPRFGRRAEVRATVETAPEDEELEGRELRRPGSVSLVEEKQTWGDRVRPLASPASSVEPLVVDDFQVEPVEDPVIGPDLAAARTRCGLTVDQLAERTRIRPHVIESIEVDDFAPCGGDFYSRGHLRTLARVLGVDAAPLLSTYEERYADAPINARRVFEAELATGVSGGIRSTRGGPNWSMLVAAVMVAVLAWSIARLAMDDPAELVSPAAPVAGESIPNFTGAADLDLSAVGKGGHVVVTDKEGEVVFEGHVGPGEGSDVVEVLMPLKVEVGKGPGGVVVAVEGHEPRELGTRGNPFSETFEARR